MGRAPGEVGWGVTASATLSQVCKVSRGSAFIPPSIWDWLKPAVSARCWEPSTDEYGRSREREKIQRGIRTTERKKRREGGGKRRKGKRGKGERRKRNRTLLGKS